MFIWFDSLEVFLFSTVPFYAVSVTHDDYLITRRPNSSFYQQVVVKVFFKHGLPLLAETFGAESLASCKPGVSIAETLKSLFPMDVPGHQILPIIYPQSLNNVFFTLPGYATTQDLQLFRTFNILLKDENGGSVDLNIAWLEGDSILPPSSSFYLRTIFSIEHGFFNNGFYFGTSILLHTDDSPISKLRSKLIVRNQSSVKQVVFEPQLDQRKQLTNPFDVSYKPSMFLVTLTKDNAIVFHSVDYCT